ncbi:MAG: hypothetical protein ACLRMZ_09445 [Blautia marasmi]
MEKGIMLHHSRSVSAYSRRMRWGQQCKKEESTKSAGSQKETQDKPEGDEKIQLTIWSLYGTNPDDKSAVAFQESVKGDHGGGSLPGDPA